MSGGWERKPLFRWVDGCWVGLEHSSSLAMAALRIGFQVGGRGSIYLGGCWVGLEHSSSLAVAALRIGVRWMGKEAYV